ncbi:tannase/feruloyl esterase family alpha/beta hydrolase [Acinetobacter calcoaceticus]
MLINKMVLPLFVSSFLIGCNLADSDDYHENIKEQPSKKDCDNLNGIVIDAQQIDIPSGKATIQSTEFHLATEDRLSKDSKTVVKATPDYCQVRLAVEPINPDAPLIHVQVNLPSQWNQKMLQYGGGGYNGVLITGLDGSRGAGPDVPLPLTQGYVTYGTDSGHQVEDGVDIQAFALNEEALMNHAYAAYKKTHDVTRFIVQRYYQQLPKKTYYMGGSEGGREALIMAQRFPADYDGIIAIDPVINWSGLQTFGNWIGGVLQSHPEAWLGEKTQIIHNAIIRACDSLDGIEDQVISNYQACHAKAKQELEALSCDLDHSDQSQCLTQIQLKVIRAAYNGYQFDFNLADGQNHYAGFAYGGEGLLGNWERWIAGSTMPAFPYKQGMSNIYNYGSGYIRYFIAQDKDFNTLHYNPFEFKDRILKVSQAIDAYNTDLSEFYARGGKIILREDMADKAQSPYTGLNYWDSVVQKMGKDIVEQFFVAYVVPGLPHTSNGIAAGSSNASAWGISGQVDLLAALDAWVVSGEKPSNNMIVKNQNNLPPYETISSKLMCRYPYYPHFIGDIKLANKAESYRCQLNQ